MDQFLLQAVVTEAGRRLVEQEVLRVGFLGRSRYLLRFATAAKDNLLLSARPDLPRLHLSGGRRVREETPDRLAAWLDKDLTGAVLVSLEKRPWDRIVELRFRLPRREDGLVERRLVLELTGRSANLLALDASGAVAAACREPRSASSGGRYEPREREDLASIPVGPEAAGEACARFGGARGFLDRVSPLFARDLEAARADEAAAARRLMVLLEAAASGAWSPVVYSRRPLDEMTEGEDAGRDDLIVSPLPLLAPPRARVTGSEPDSGVPLVATPFESASRAACSGLGLLERLRDFKDLREHHETLVRRENERLESLCHKLEQELVKARDSDRHKRLGEALLAGLTAARVEGKVAVVADPYGPAGAEVEVPIDPSLPLPENARLLFERYKKGKRGAVTIQKRLVAARAHLERWRALAAPAAAARTTADLDELRDGMARLGLVHARRAGPATAPRRRKEEPARVRRYTSPEGLTILVGKSGEENDNLTFRVASPWDFWLHAADRPGAHVVVRNPQRLKALPENSLKFAAQIAAWHSGARQESSAEVHYTQRKHVHKKKGMPGGQVLLRRFRTIQVTPRLPSSTLEEF